MRNRPGGQVGRQHPPAEPAEHGVQGQGLLGHGAAHATRLVIASRRPSSRPSRWPSLHGADPSGRSERRCGCSSCSTHRRGRGRRLGRNTSPPQTFDPCVCAVIGNLHGKAVESPLQSSTPRQPDEEGVDEALAARTRRLLPHPADCLRRDSEPHLVAGVQLGPNQRVRPLGSRPAVRGMRVRIPPGQSSRWPSMTIIRPSSVHIAAGSQSSASRPGHDGVVGETARPDRAHRRHERLRRRPVGAAGRRWPSPSLSPCPPPAGADEAAP